MAKYFKSQCQRSCCFDAAGRRFAQRRSMNGDSSEHYGGVVLVTLTSSHPNGVVFHLVPRGCAFAGYYEVPKWSCRTKNTCRDKARVTTKAWFGRASAAA